ncbi:hypothetical protein AKJ16_DCAP03526 [Drosera capensis]
MDGAVPPAANPRRGLYTLDRRLAVLGRRAVPSLLVKYLRSWESFADFFLGKVHHPLSCLLEKGRGDLSVLGSVIDDCLPLMRSFIEADGMQDMAAAAGVVPGMEPKEDVFDPLATPDVDRLKQHISLFMEEQSWVELGGSLLHRLQDKPHPQQQSTEYDSWRSASYLVKYDLCTDWLLCEVIGT